jgi:hypothetical protein
MVYIGQKENKGGKGRKRRENENHIQLELLKKQKVMEEFPNPSPPA